VPTQGIIQSNDHYSQNTQNRLRNANQQWDLIWS